MKHLRKYFLLFLLFGVILFLGQGMTSQQVVMEEKTSAHIVELALPELRIIGVYSAVPEHEKLEAASAAAFKKLGKYLRKNKLKPSTPFLTVYFSGPETGSIRFICGVASEHEIPDLSAPVQAHTMQGGCYVRVTHVGSYEGLETAHDQIKAYMETNNLPLGGPVWHEYAAAPHMYADSTKWVTHVYYPVIKENCGK